MRESMQVCESDSGADHRTLSLAAQGADSIDRIEPQARVSLVCFSHLRWDFVWQRPQHLLLRAARQFDILFVEEPIFRPGANAHLEVTDRSGGVRVVVPVLPEGSSGSGASAAQSRLVGDLLADIPAPRRIVWYYTPMAMAFTHGLDAALVIYDNMDELSAFRGASPEMLSCEDELLRRADLVFTGGISLYEAKRQRHPSVHAFPSSIDAAHFGAGRRRTSAEPDDQADIPHPRLGFFGVIDERMDIDLVRAVAEGRPDWHLVMIGPVVKIDPATLPRGANIHWLGPKTYDELPSYLAGWDVGLMPFALNESTRFISPTKTPEYLAAGVPVVSTPIRDVVRTYGEPGLVAIARSAADVIAEAEALMAGSRGPWLDRVDRHLSATSWDRTWGEMLGLIEGRLAPEAGMRPLAAARPFAAAAE